MNVMRGWIEKTAGRSFAQDVLERGALIRGPLLEGRWSNAAAYTTTALPFVHH